LYTLLLEWVVRGSHSGRCRARAPTRVRIAHGGGKITTNKAVALRNYYLRMLRSGETLTELQRKAAADAGLDLAAMQAEVQPGGKESMKEALRRQLKEAEAKHALLLLQAAAAKGASGGGAAAGQSAPAKRRRLDDELEGIAGTAQL
jgi:pyruvate/2-oxoglutarate dehydrogenase complex dihydrolipoamide acyltransferase (E2) component